MRGIMNYKDKIKTERAIESLLDSYRLTRLYSVYLERFPELITSEMIDALTSDTDITKEYAIGAILTEAFGLDDAKEEDRRLIRKLLYPSVRILKKERYTENPYYKNIPLADVSLGAWQIKWEKYPPYRAMTCDDMILAEDFSEIAPLGFFEEEFVFPAVLEGGNEWMTLSPIDIDTCDEAIEDASGRVVTFGLGLGYYAYMVSEKEEVKSITVVEKSRDVIELFEKFILPHFPHKEKVKIVCEDAFVYAEKEMPREKFDYAFVDTWRDAGDGAPMYKRMKALENLSESTRFSYWIEGYLKSRVRAENFGAIYEEYKAGKIADYEEFVSRLTRVL